MTELDSSNQGAPGPADLDAEFCQDRQMVYHNHAALGPWPKRCSEAISEFAQQNCYRGAADFATWYRTEAAVREQLAWLINAPAVTDIALLKNTSEGLSTIAWGLPWQAGDKVVIGAQEFPSNRLPWLALRRLGVQTHEVDLYADDDPEAALIAALDDNTRLLSVSAVQYDTGLSLDLARLGAACAERDCLFCVDAIQVLGAQPFDVQAVGAHFVAADAHKWMLAPEGIALLYVAESIRPQLQLFQQGWRMVDDYFVFDRDSWLPSDSARRFEAGSGNTMGMVGLSASLSLFQELGMQQVCARLQNNIDTLIDGLSGLPGLTLRTPVQPQRRAGIVNFSLDGIRDRDLHRFLVDRQHICSVRNGLRLAPGFYHSATQMEATLAAIEQAQGTL